MYRTVVVQLGQSILVLEEEVRIEPRVLVSWFSHDGWIEFVRIVNLRNLSINSAAEAVCKLTTNTRSRTASA